ncbi:methyltransferase domain-containing protein [Streptomonospora sediminis]
MTSSEAFAAVDREPFIPATIYVRSEDTGWPTPLHRDDDPDTWRSHVRSDRPVVTAIAPDPRAPAHILDPATGRGYTSASSSSDPRTMARMIDILELQPGMRVLEIGSGTGWNAALLAHIVGPGAVTTVEVDAGLAAHARAALDAADCKVQVVTGDGARGHPPGAPYDRVVATAAVHTLPYPWVAQTRPGGLIVVPWAPTFHPDGPLVVLTVGEDGSARGRFAGPAPFMPLHGQGLAPAAVDVAREHWEEAGRPRCERFGLTATREGQRVWLDDPGCVVQESAAVR